MITPLPGLKIYEERIGNIRLLILSIVLGWIFMFVNIEILQMEYFENIVIELENG